MSEIGGPWHSGSERIVITIHRGENEKPIKRESGPKLILPRCRTRGTAKRSAGSVPVKKLRPDWTVLIIPGMFFLLIFLIMLLLKIIKSL